MNKTELERDKLNCLLHRVFRDIEGEVNSSRKIFLSADEVSTLFYCFHNDVHSRHVKYLNTLVWEKVQDLGSRDFGNMSEIRIFGCNVHVFYHIYICEESNQ